jgi:hypothetical protein
VAAFDLIDVQARGNFSRYIMAFIGAEYVLPDYDGQADRCHEILPLRFARVCRRIMQAAQTQDLAGFETGPRGYLVGFSTRLDWSNRKHERRNGY